MIHLREQFGKRARFVDGFADAVQVEMVAGSAGGVGGGNRRIGLVSASIVTLGWILARKLQDQIDDFLGRGWSADRSTLGAVIPLLGNQLPVPAQDRVRCERRADFCQELASQDFAFDRQPAPLVVIEQNPF